MVNHWVAQLSAKHVGQKADGIIYELDTILRDHLLFRSAYGAIVVDGDEFQFMSGPDPMFGWFLTIVPEAFDTKEQAQQWCKDHGFVNGGCYARVFQPPYV